MAVSGLPEDITFLRATNSYQDDEGAWHEGKREPRTVQCHVINYGALTRGELRSSEVRTQNVSDSPYTGMHVVAVVEVWSIDYEGEEQAIFRGKEVQVEHFLVYGQKEQLMLRERIGNVTEE